MKKLLLCLAILSLMTFAACSEDEAPASTYSCVTCTETVYDQTHEVCNHDGSAYVDGTLVGPYDYWLNFYREQGYTCQ